MAMRPLLLNRRRGLERLERRLLLTADIDLSSFVGAAIPDGDVSPSAIKTTDFGTIASVGATLTRTFVITNFGNTALNLTNTPRVQITGPNATDFSVTVQPPASVASGTNTTFQVTFDPAAVGLRTATVSIVSNDPDEGTYDFAIQGTGSAVVISTSEIDLSSLTGVSIPDGDASPNTTKTTDFGNVAATGGAGTRTFVISSFGTGPLTLTGTPRVQVSGTNAADFTVTVQPPSIVTNGTNTTFQVTFDPSSTGLRTATLTIGSDDSDENPYDFAIQGTGTTANVNVDIDLSSLGGVSIPSGDISPSAAKTTDYGDVAITGGSVTRTFVISNFGTQTLNLTGPLTVQLGGPQSFDFSVTNFAPANVAAGTNTTFDVKFDPSGPSTRSATVRIVSNDPDESPYTFAIAGNGTTLGGTVDIDLSSLGGVAIPTGDISPTLGKTTDFGTVGVGASQTNTFVITNFGSSALSLTGAPRVQISGTNAADFTVTALPPATVSALSNTTFAIRFSPGAATIRNATVTILSNDADENPYTFNIRGTGAIAMLGSMISSSAAVDELLGSENSDPLTDSAVETLLA